MLDPAHPRPEERRPVVGLLLNTLFDGYEEVIWRGVIRAAEELDVDLVALLGGPPADPGEAPSVYGLLWPEDLDGVIVMSPAVGYSCGQAGVARYLERFASLPIVSLSERFPGVPSIQVDNRIGMASVLQHLVAHGRRRIAFVRGPPSASDAQERYRVYQEELAWAGIPFDPALVVNGDHWPTSGVRAVRVLMDERRVPFDALVGSNDQMAIAAMQELQRRGVGVPGNVAVAGFDDITDAASTSPSLTTARQPLLEMGREAVRRVLSMIRGERVEQEVRLAAKLQLRQSCGCSGLEGGSPPREEPPVEGDRSAAALAAAMEAAFPDFGARLGIPTWATDLASALPAGPGREGELDFLHALERLLLRGLDPLPEPGPWLRVIRELMARALRGATEEDAARLVALSDAADALVASMASNAELARRMRTDMETKVLARMSQPFPLPEDLFIPNLLGALEALNVRSFFLSRFLGPDLREATLLVHHDPYGVAELDAPAGDFPAHRLVPGRFSARSRRSHVVLPIQSPDGPIGFALCEIGSMNPMGYEMLMHELSAVLGVNALMSELQDQHRQLLDTARQAGMAEVAVGALHNVGNLLSSVSISADQIRAAAASAAGSGLPQAAALIAGNAADLPAYLARDPQAAALPGYLEKAVGALWKDLARIQAEALDLQEKTGLIRESIRALQDHARGLPDHVVREPVEVPELLRSALEIQRVQLARWGVQVRQELGSLPPIVTQRSKLMHVLVNLVKNAVEAMRSVPEGQRVLLLRGERLEDGRVLLEVKDTGEGIAPVDLARIFTYGFTTKRDGHGFGLYTCARYVKQLGGSIGVASEGAGRGATFRLVLDPGGGERGAPPGAAAVG